MKQVTVEEVLKAHQEYCVKVANRIPLDKLTDDFVEYMDAISKLVDDLMNLAIQMIRIL